MRRLAFALLLASFSTSLFAACGDDDGGGGPVDAGLPDLGEPDMDLAPSRLFGACERDSQCPGVGARCRRPSEGWPNGYCTVPCTPPDLEPCLDEDMYYNHCLTDGNTGESWCERRCLNGVDCARNGYTCVGQFPPMDQGMCVGLCLSDDDCSRGEVCDPDSGRCVGALPTTGGTIGARCGADGDCRSSSCITEVDSDGFPSGFVGGACVALCVLPAGYNQNSFYSEAALPRGTCPGGAICFPNRSFAEGDPGLCLDECGGPADCGPGLECAKDFPLASGDVARFDNGVCLPVDCQRDGCPSGYACQPIPVGGGRNIYRCGPT